MSLVLFSTTAVSRAGPLLLLPALLWAAPAAAQHCTPDYRELASAVYAQVLEFGRVSPDLDYWSAQFRNGATVKQMMEANAKWPGYYARFINMKNEQGVIVDRDSRAILTDLYRHILAREPAEGAWGWISVGEDPSGTGWDRVIEGLLNSAEYNKRFGDHVVPGSPVVAWDCARAGRDTVAAVVAAHHEGYRDATQGSASVSYTTPAYVSLDQPRSLTFTYSGALADPRSFVAFDVLDNTGDPPDRISLEVWNESGARMTFTDGSQQLFFRAGTGASRIAGEFRETQHPNRSVGYRAVVRKHWPGGRVQEHTVNTRAAHLTTQGSELGRGWVLEGYQRLYDQSEAVHITEGGVGVMFWRVGTDANGDRRYASPSGDFTTVRWNVADTTYHRLYPDGTRVRFWEDGKMRDVADRFGNVTRYGYDGAGRLVTVEDPVGKKMTLGYNGGGALAWVQDPAGRRVTTETYYGTIVGRFREPDGSLALDLHYVDSPQGLVLDSYWTPAGDRNAGVHTGFTFGYDAHGRVASVTAPQVATTDAGTMRPTTQVRSLQAAVLSATATNSGNPAARVIPADVRVEVRDPRGNLTRMAVDPFGQPTRIEEPLGNTTVLTRDRHGRVMRTQPASGAAGARAEYRGVELHLREDLQTAATVQMEYEPRYHQLKHAWGAGTAEVWNYYSAEARLDSTRTGTSTSPVTKYGYATRGRISSVTDPEGHSTQVTYESSGAQNTATIALPAANGGSYTTTMVYDALGRMVKRLSPTGDSIKVVYDVLNRVTRSTDPAGRATGMAYDGTGMYRLTDPKGQVYSFQRNTLGWLRSETDPRGTVVSFGYDRAGNQTTATNRRGQTVSFTHDALGRILTRSADGATTTFEYSPSYSIMPWVAASNAESTDTLHFDHQGRVTRQVSWLNGRRYQLDSYYPNSGPRTSLEVHSALSRRTGYRYDSASRLSELTDLAGGVSLLNYNRDGQLTGVRLPTGVSRGFSYNDRHLISKLTYSGAAEPKLGESYEYDWNHRMAQRMNSVGDTLHLYGYDPAGQITSDQKQVKVETGLVCADPLRADSCQMSYAWQNDALAAYGYDAAGNRTDRSGQSDTGNRLAGFDGYSFEHDADGNLTRKWKSGVDDVRPTWNSLGQMTGAWRHQRGTVAYGYNGFGQRVRRTAADGSVTRYLYEGDDLLMELDDAGTPVREYTYYPGVDQPHSVRSAGQTYYYATDAVGHVTGLLNGSGEVVNRYAYTPWGEIASAQETVAQPLGYMAREYDAVTGLYYVRARWYDAHQGRFVSEDPIGLAGGLNVYAYVGNSPTNGTDPTGLNPTIQECVQQLMGAVSQVTEAQAEAYCTSAKVLPGVRNSGGWAFPTGRSQGYSSNFGNRGSVVGPFGSFVSIDSYTSGMIREERAREAHENSPSHRKWVERNRQSRLINACANQSYQGNAGRAAVWGLGGAVFGGLIGLVIGGPAGGAAGAGTALKTATVSGGSAVVWSQIETYSNARADCRSSLGL